MSIVMQCLEVLTTNPPQRIQKKDKDGGVQYFITNEAGDVVSSLMCYDYNMDEFKWDLLADIDTVPEYRGRGLATKLISDAYRDATSTHKDGVYLFVRDTNHNAISLYKKLGFRNVKPYRLYGEKYFIMAKGHGNLSCFDNMNFS